MRRAGLVLAASIAAGCLSAAPPAAAQTPTQAQAQAPAAAGRTYGVWRNPKDSVHVEIRPCGSGACGIVVWASAKAQADARKGGTANLVGLQIFRDLVRDKAGVWRGKVFVPDLNMTLTGSAEPIDAGSLRARGCLFANVACKSQIWRRVDAAADVDRL
jgi:uncharacterized protein (DUF2147 family)